MMMKLLLIAVIAIAFISVSALTIEEVPSYADYVAKYNKNYSPVEYTIHEAIFNRHVVEMLAHDESRGWTVGINKFTDMTANEYASFAKGRKKHGFVKTSTAPNLKGMKEGMIEGGVNWANMNATTPVKDQGACGSCWAFSTIETIESYQYLTTGKMDTLSAQQLVDCVENPKHCGGTGGCEGGTYELGFAYVMQQGLATEADYPYQAVDQTCHDAKVQKVSYLSSFTSIRNNKNATITALNHGPLSISVDADQFKFYVSGIFNGCDANKPDINHAVQMVGYGTEGSQNYWIVRNSWGPDWGENGFIRILMKDEPTCAMDTTPQDGDGCEGETEPVEVCGTCGVLYDTAYVTYIA